MKVRLAIAMIMVTTTITTMSRWYPGNKCLAPWVRARMRVDMPAVCELPAVQPETRQRTPPS